MASLDLKAIADAIAARFSGVTAGGVALAVGPTASLPNTIAKGPALLVYPPTGDLSIGPMRQRDDTYDFPVRLLIDPLHYDVRSDALYAWGTVLRDRVEADMDLGLAYVTWARVVSLRLDLNRDDLYGTQFDVVEVVVQVRVREVVSTVSV